LTIKRANEKHTLVSSLGSDSLEADFVGVEELLEALQFGGNGE
jgi:hypothetical protein